jgi:hypothetical protein
MFRKKLVSTILMTLALLAYTLHTIAQTAVSEVKFQNNSVTLKENGDKDTISVIDPVVGDTIIKLLPVLYPVKINGLATEAEKKPYTISADMRKILAAAIINGKYLTSIFKGKPLPDGIFILGLTNIVITPDGSVAYYNFYKSDYYLENEKVSRTIDLQKDIANILNEKSKLFKQKFKESYLVLNGKITTMTFRVHNGTIKLASSK